MKQEIVHGILRERWVELDDDNKQVWRKWASWDKKRYERDLAIYEGKSGKAGDAPKANGDKDDSMHVPKKRKSSSEADMDDSAKLSIPKKRKSHA